jgi:hypothetical protein
LAKDLPAGRPLRGEGEAMVGLMGLMALIAQTGTIFWVLAVILVIAGIVTLLRGGILVGVILIIAGLAVGPGGWFIFD